MDLAIFNIIAEKDSLFSLLYELFYNGNFFVYFLYTDKLIDASICLG